MRFLLLHEIQLWAWNSQLVDRIPNGGDEQREYRRTSLYSNHPLIDTGTWMPFTPTILVADVRFGTDKIAHLVSSGWTYYGEYREGIEKGETPEEAERRAVSRGILEESLILGKLASGVHAIPDIEAHRSSALPYVRGAVGIAHSGKDTGGSQWFVTLSEQPHLVGRYTVFGEVTRGLEVFDRMQPGDTFGLEVAE